MMGCSSDSKLSSETSGWSFPLPELPKGVELIINILSTWGDKHYLGLTGIEVFTGSGEKADISKVHAYDYIHRWGSNTIYNCNFSAIVTVFLCVE